MARTHGKISTYQYGCRCDDCRKAKQTRNRKRNTGERPLRAFSPGERAWYETEAEFFHDRLQERA